MPLAAAFAALAPLAHRPGHAAFFVDYDGSLAPIVGDPDAARPLPAARDALARLVPLLGRVVVVSGRSVSFLADHLEVEGLGFAGLYGLERLVGGELVVAPGADEWAPAIRESADEADRRLPGIHVERKGRLAVTLHWRSSPDRRAEVEEFAASCRIRLGVSLLHGRMSVELRPPVPVDKGTVVEELARGMRAAAFAGDDAGDLPAFAALLRLRDRAALDTCVRVGVRSTEAPPEILDADVVVDGPLGLAVLLDALADAISERS